MSIDLLHLSPKEIPKVLLQRPQLFLMGFSQIILWCKRFVFSVKPLPQVRHKCGEWTFAWWLVRFLSPKKPLPQIGQKSFLDFSWVWTLLCLVRLPDWPNLLPQILQANCSLVWTHFMCCSMCHSVRILGSFLVKLKVTNEGRIPFEWLRHCGCGHLKGLAELWTFMWELSFDGPPDTLQSCSKITPVLCMEDIEPLTLPSYNNCSVCISNSIRLETN